MKQYFLNHCNIKQCFHFQLNYFKLFLAHTWTNLFSVLILTEERVSTVFVRTHRDMFTKLVQFEPHTIISLIYQGKYVNKFKNKIINVIAYRENIKNTNQIQDFVG